jgi:hypothetical protein
LVIVGCGTCRDLDLWGCGLSRRISVVQKLIEVFPIDQGLRLPLDSAEVSPTHPFKNGLRMYLGNGGGLSSRQLSWGSTLVIH